MPIRRLNYTKRRKLTRDQVQISLTPARDGLPRSFSAELNLPSDLPGAARIFVEAYRTSPASRMRFFFGTVDAPHRPRPEECRLDEFTDDLPPLFRVKITDVGEGHGRIVADAQRIQPHLPDEEPDRRRGILYITYRDNDGLVWELDYDPSLGPILYIDNGADPYRELPGRIEFKALVYPEIIRQVLVKVLVEDRDSIEDPDGWQHRWVSFPRKAFGFTEPIPADTEDPETWITSAVKWCARKAAFAKSLAPAEVGE